MLRDSSSPRNLEDDPCPPAALGHPLTEGPVHSDHLLGIAIPCSRGRAGAAGPGSAGTRRTLRLLSSACLAWVALMARYAFLFFSKFSGTSGIRRLGLREEQPGHTPVPSRSPRSPRTPRMAADPAFPAPLPPRRTHSSSSAILPRLPRACAGLRWGRGGSPQAPLAFPGMAESRKAPGPGKGRGAGLPSALAGTSTHDQPGRGAATATGTRGGTGASPAGGATGSRSLAWCWAGVPEGSLRFFPCAGQRRDVCLHTLKSFSVLTPKT